MSGEEIVLLAAGAIFVVTAVSGRLHRAWLTEPLVATGIGILVGVFLIEPASLEDRSVLLILELTLALVLFSDASRIDVGRLRTGFTWPLRMLLVGLPGVILLGWLVGTLYLGLQVGMALLLAAILAPTDAALSEPVLESEIVPSRVRQALNIESGLNDGLAVPVVLIGIGLIETATGGTAGRALGVVLSQLGIGVVGGVALGWLGAKLIGRGTEAGWMNPLHQKIAAVALALAGFAAVQLLGGSGFVATFIAGGLMAHVIRPQCEYLYQFAEAEGHSLVLVAFFIFGIGPAVTVLEGGISPEAFVVAILSLVVLRPLAIAVSLFGQRLHLRTIVFLGWFGPRGLATVVFLLFAVEELEVLPELVMETVTITVLLSILAHGLTAVPMSRWLARMRMEEDVPEMGEVYEYPMRRG